MNTIIHATRPADLLGIVPALAGFTPRRSLVLLPFRDTRADGAMRVDLPDPDIDPDEFADAAVHALLQVSGIDAAAIVVYTDEPAQPVPDGLLLPHLVLVEALADVAADAGLRLVDALCVTPQGWADYREDEPTVQSLDGIPHLPDIPGVGDLSGDQRTGAQLPPSDLVEREQVGRALAELDDVLERHREGRAAVGASENPLALATAEVLLDGLPSFVEGMLDDPSDIGPYSCAALLWCLERPVLRDAILVQWATDLSFGHRALEAQLEFSHQHTEVPPAIGEVFLGRGAQPDPDRLGCALEVVRLAASRAPRRAKPAALTAAAWLAWALGRSSHAGCYVDEALELDPQHSMASLISTMLSAALLPEWVLRRR
ncbi:DUF4192 family protein [Microbacterium sp. ARD32]|uniref:DUF4192 family protein n=1 Tax=Microbacterium sp. ARD32 TaxID=2962577 RepID=UPI002881E852|nr:DUF4192 family protein [Microbacterium sp. ARD32]MDT0156171.1 DUF4192 family protein [Microbacterium sp. ARD32]